MKQIIAAVLTIICIVSIVTTAFTFYQVQNERARQRNDIEQRSILATESLKEAIEPNVVNKANGVYLQSLVERFANEKRFAGLAIYDNKEHLIAISSTLPKDIFTRNKVVSYSMDQDAPQGDFATIRGQKMYVFATPLHQKNDIVGSLVAVQNAGYIDKIITDVWKTNAMRLLVQIVILTLTILLALYWILRSSINNISSVVKHIREGKESDDLKKMSRLWLFGPLFVEVDKFKKSLMQARLSASEEARLRLAKIDSPWTPQRLKESVKDTIKDQPIFVVSNREPYIHEKDGKNVRFFQPASGMVTALEPIMEASGGEWIAHGSGSADKFVVDENNNVPVPPDEPSYSLHRIWLTAEEEQGYYYGFSNEGMWPLCHNTHTRPIFRKEDWEYYKKVNAKFAEEVLAQIKKVERPVILIQDFHLALVPQIVKKARPDAKIGIFWHIPWPNHESFSICPWKKEILDGMLGADLLGFHTQLHCNNFIETVGKELESLVNYEQFTITRAGHTSYIRPFPVSIPIGNKSNLDTRKQTEEIRRKLLKDLGIRSKYIGVGVDRLDYTKGIMERLKGVELFLTNYSNYVKEFTFIQAAAPSRDKIKRYQELAREVEAEINRINKHFATRDWRPIVYLKKHHSHQEVNNFYKAADVALVTSLHDGMNLVAKEFIAARDDNKGVLILSQFTGAANELTDAIIVNPYNAVETAEAIKEAVEMRPLEQVKRMKKMRATIQNYNTYRWSADFVRALVNLGDNV